MSKEDKKITQNYNQYKKNKNNSRKWGGRSTSHFSVDMTKNGDIRCIGF